MSARQAGVDNTQTERPGFKASEQRLRIPRIEPVQDRKKPDGAGSLKFVGQQNAPAPGGIKQL